MTGVARRGLNNPLGGSFKRAAGGFTLGNMFARKEHEDSGDMSRYHIGNAGSGNLGERASKNYRAQDSMGFKVKMGKDSPFDQKDELKNTHNSIGLDGLSKSPRMFKADMKGSSDMYSDQSFGFASDYDSMSTSSLDESSGSKLFSSGGSGEDSSGGGGGPSSSNSSGHHD